MSDVDKTRTVPFLHYWRVIVALRRCHSIMTDMLPNLPEDKQTDVRIYLNILGDMQDDALVYAEKEFLKDIEKKRKERALKRRKK